MSDTKDDTDLLREKRMKRIAQVKTHIEAMDKQIKIEEALEKFDKDLEDLLNE